MWFFLLKRQLCCAAAQYRKYFVASVDKSSLNHFLFNYVYYMHWPIMEIDHNRFSQSQAVAPLRVIAAVTLAMWTMYTCVSISQYNQGIIKIVMTSMLTSQRAAKQFSINGVKPSWCIINQFITFRVEGVYSMMCDSNYGVMTARMPYCPWVKTVVIIEAIIRVSLLCSLTCCASMDTRDMYLTSSCNASFESSSYLCSSTSPAHHHQYHSSCARALYHGTQSSHTSPAPVEIPPYKYTSSAEIPAPLVTGNSFTQPPAGMICNEQQIMSPTDHKTNDEKIKMEDSFPNLRVVTPEGSYKYSYHCSALHTL